jgi:hypothetical protein
MQFSNRIRGTLLATTLALFSIVGLAAFSRSNGVDTDVVCEYKCRTCSLGHDIVTAVDNDVESEHLENCNAGDCSSHTACKPQ